MTAPSVLAALGVVGGCELVLGLWALLLAPTTIIPSLGTNESHARPLLAHIGSLRIAVSLFLLSALLDVYESIATLVLAVGALNACVLQLAAASLYPIPHATPAKRLAAAALVEGFAALFGQCAAFGFAERAVIHAPAALLTVCSVGAAVPLALVAVNRRAARHAVRTASPHVPQRADGPSPAQRESEGDAARVAAAHRLQRPPRALARLEAAPRLRRGSRRYQPHPLCTVVQHDC